MLRLKNDFGKWLMANAFPQHDAAVQRYLGRFISSDRERPALRERATTSRQYGENLLISSPSQQNEEDLLVGAEVFNCGAPRPDLPPQDVVKDLANIFLPLKTPETLHSDLSTSSSESLA